MAGQGDSIEHRLRDLRISNRAPEGHRERQGSSDGQQTSQDSFHQKISLRQWEESSSDDEPEISIKSVTNSIFVGHHTIVQRPENISGTACYDDNNANTRLTHTAVPANTSRARQRALPNVGGHEPTQAFGMEEGEPAKKGLKFVPFKLVKKYPYLYVGKSNQDEVRFY